MRIIAGAFRGTQLAAPPPKDMSIRPTTDRMRETLFNILAHLKAGEPITGARVLDLFAGTGALGLEAMSRGARFCLFVDPDVTARALIRRNIETLGLTGVTKVFRRDATRLGEAATFGRFSLAFLDPPYGQGLGEQALACLAEGGWLEPDAIVVLEEKKGLDLPVPDGFSLLQQRDSGDSEIRILRFSQGTGG
jgi:16S rRNA (guanine966-N2)-methyltransferase